MTEYALILAAVAVVVFVTYPCPIRWRASLRARHRLPFDLAHFGVSKRRVCRGLSSFGAALAELLVGTGRMGVIFGAGWAKGLEIALIVPFVTDGTRCETNPKSGASAIPPLSRELPNY
jgi:hypothetical protein